MAHSFNQNLFVSKQLTMSQAQVDNVASYSLTYDVSFLFTSGPHISDQSRSVRVVGYRLNAIEAIEAIWQSNSLQARLFAESMLGDRMAESLLEAGVTDDQYEMIRAARLNQSESPIPTDPNELKQALAEEVNKATPSQERIRRLTQALEVKLNSA